MDDRALRLALEALLDEPTLKSVHRASIERGLADLRVQRLSPDERAYLCVLIEHYAAPAPSADPVAALIAAFQDKLPSIDPSALSTAIHALVAGDAAQLDGKPLALTIERRGQIQIANLAEHNLVMGDLNQLDMSVHIPIPDARFDHLLQAAFQRQTHERITKAAQQIESDRLLNLRLQGFVGRVNELAAIREHIEAMRPTGGYVLIKAAAGEGKSSSIAKLIQEAGIAATPHHFIALTTGREYQLGLLRAVVAQLILKHHLTVSYFPEESYPAMKAEFARILDELSKQGINETIYLDGLDQLQPEIDGSRDLSFLPPQPPPGIVIVLGSRPDETLKPLEILHRVDYDLPPLSEDDALALWRSVQPGVADGLLHDLYTALKGNALFVHLAANTMRGTSVVDATSLIRQIEQNPQNLFGITLDRIKRVPQSRWDSVWKPMLALLLVAQEPLRLDVLGDLLGHDHDTMQDAVWVLGGLVSQGIDQRVALHHLLFRDYLEAVIFNAREVKRWHQRLADWCEKDLDAVWADDRDAVEQARRMYVRHHYMTHLSMAEDWTTLWKVLDAGNYGEQKTRFDPSTRLYALDLDRGRESAIKAGQSVEEHIQNLPRLWKYSLLRTSLTSWVDQWPDELFVKLAMLRRTQEALERIELLSSAKQQISRWIHILPWCDEQQQHTIIIRLYEVGRHLLGIDRIFVIRTITEAITAHGHLKKAIRLLDAALTLAQTCDHPKDRDDALIMITETTATRGDIDHALSIARSIEDPANQTKALCAIAEVAATRSDIDRALTIADSIGNLEHRAQTLCTIVEVAATCGDIDRALTIADSIVSLKHRAQTLCTIAEVAATCGDIDRALTIADSIGNLKHRAQTLRAIAEVAATCGDIDRALTIAHSVDDLVRHVHTLHTAVTLDDIDSALTTIAQTFDYPWDRAQTLSVIAEVPIARGNINSALTTIAQTIGDPVHRAQTLRAIAGAAATRGDIDRALTIAHSIDTPTYRAQTLRAIVETTITRDDIDRALTIAQTISNLEHQSNALRAVVEAIITRGDIDRALSIAKSINDPMIRSDCLRIIIETMATSGDIDRALSITKSISNPSHNTRILKIIAATMATHGDIDRALTIAHSIDDPEHRGLTLVDIAEAAAIRDDIDRALTIANSIKYRWARPYALSAIAEAAATHGDIDRALTIAHSIDDPEHRGLTLVDIAEAAAIRGDIDRALTIAHSIDAPEHCFQALHSIAVVAATRGDIDHAFTIANSIGNLYKRVHALRAITVVAATHGHRDQTIETLDTSLRTQTFDYSWDRGYTLRAIVEAIATGGDIDHALSMAHSIDNSVEQTKTLRAIAEVAATRGDIDRALTIAHSINHPSYRDDTLRAIVEATATLNDIDRALSIVQIFDLPVHRAHALLSIAETTATRGDIDRALTIAHSIDDLVHRTQTLLYIAGSGITHGQRKQVIEMLDTALTLTQTIDLPAHRADSFRAIAEVAATLGDIDRALTIAHSIDHLARRADSFRTIAEVAATLGDIDRALTISHSIDHPVHRADALIMIIETTATRGDIDRALTISQIFDHPAHRFQALRAIAEAAATRGDIDRALTIAHSIDDVEHRFQALRAIAVVAATRGDIDRALTIAHSIDHSVHPFQALTHSIDDSVHRFILTHPIDAARHRFQALRAIAEVAATRGDIDRALTIAQFINEPKLYVDTLRMMIQWIQSLKTTLLIIQKEWLRSTVSRELWIVTAVITPLIKDCPWLATAILEEEAWVNAQLKRLG